MNRPGGCYTNLPRTGNRKRLGRDGMNLFMQESLFYYFIGCPHKSLRDKLHKGCYTRKHSQSLPQSRNDRGNAATKLQDDCLLCYTRQFLVQLVIVSQQKCETSCTKHVLV
jgi:hypothetical protein